MTQSFTGRRQALAGAVAGLAATAQPAAAQPLPRPPAAPPAARPPASSPLVRGFSRERLGRIAGVMQAEAERGSFPGAVTLIARQGEIIHFEAYGHQDAAKTKPMPRDAIFLQASMTKPLTSALALMLVEEGRMKLDDPIAEVLPELRDLKVEQRQDDQSELVPATRQPAIHDLLRHTAGFVYSGASPSPRIKAAYEEANIEAGRGPIGGEEMLRQLGAIPLAFQPGTTFFYSIATDVLGLLVSRVAGKRLDQAMEERLLAPLGMRDTHWFVPPEKRARLAEAPDSDPQKATMWAQYRILTDERATSYLKGGAGLVSTAADYIRFAQMMANGGVLEGRRYLAAPVVNFMMSNHITGMAGSPTASTGPGYGFGLGFGVRLADGMGTAPGSPGDAMWAGAWGTSFTIDRAEGLVAILMAQGPSNRVRTRMIWKDVVYGAMVESLRRG
ncbi:beta-lactamase family protein [Siccirubricoccus sp. KC 17139]|uniref:Beta-lactamase family protein n=1 Tax=Siccirubricoccus soli TaxID=2899147 RepID=A0ABT1D9E0_9PROT|nr:serine hydrolase domain-containing protein [Siccirubricoccus soli]MCO6418533.1 beta-lactamase family protein [Siccirubricoccus soli]MCP2684668.1 beta-lactamase family protein [Siccirubricoccus soli]